MKKTIILHVGLPKTGTTSIQHFCRRQQRWLQRRAIEYPIPFVNTGERGNPQLSLLGAFFGELPQSLRGPLDGIDCRAALTKTIQDFRQGDARTLLISHETLLERSDELLYDELLNLAGDCEITVVAYVRPFDDWIESRYRQNVLNTRGRIRPITQTWLCRDMEEHFFVPKLIGLERGLPNANIMLRSFDACRKQGNLLHDFLQCLGVKKATSLSLPNYNVKHPLEAMFIYHLRRGGAPAETVADVTRALRRAKAVTLFGSERKFGFLPPKEKRRARQIYNEHLGLLNERFGYDESPSSVNEDVDYTTSLTEPEFRAIADRCQRFLANETAMPYGR